MERIGDEAGKPMTEAVIPQDQAAPYRLSAGEAWPGSARTRGAG
jgi:hypothetical protein